MRLETTTNETLLYILAFGFALAARFLLLDNTPLSDNEAVLALQALGITQGKTVVLTGQPGYVLLTSFLFFMTEASDFLARFIPAIIGGLIAFIPILFRSSLGRLPALVMAFALALDPGLVAISRQADGSILAVCFLLLAVAGWLDQRLSITVIAFALAFLGGPTFWLGFVAILLSLFMTMWLGKKGVMDDWKDYLPSPPESRRPVLGREKIWTVFLGAIITLLVVVSLFIRIPGGLSIITASLPEYLSSFTRISSLNPGAWLASLIIYHPIPFIFGLWGAINNFRLPTALGYFLTNWFFFALVLGLFNPSRQPLDLVWVTIPLWALAARQITRVLPTHMDELFPLVAQALLVVIVSVFIWFNTAALSVSLQLSQDRGLEGIIVIFGAVLLLFLTSYLIAWGWSFKASGYGLLTGFIIVLSVYSLSMSSAVVSQPGELLTNSQNITQADLLLDTLGDLSQWTTGRTNGLEISVTGVDSPALIWALRNFHQASFVNYLVAGSMPAIVITPNEQQPTLAASYRGQDFTWTRETSWRQMQLIDWLKWWLNRSSPRHQKEIILWARTDIFPDDSLAPGLSGVP